MGSARLGVCFAGVHKFVYATVNIMSKQKGLVYFGFNVSELKIKKTTDELREQQHESMMPPGRVENSSLTRKKIMFSLTVKRHLTVQGSHKKSENRIPWLICFFPGLPFSHGFTYHMVMIVLHNMHDSHKLESCHSHENKQFEDFSITFWDIFIFQHFSMTGIFFQDFPWPC